MKFSIKEIIDIAIAIEDSGYYFYTRCGEKFTDKTYKGLFDLFAEQELVHKEKFEEILSNVDDVSGQFPDEYYQYLMSIGDEKVFSDKNDIDRVVKNFSSPLDAIKLALTAEKNSILFYSELKMVYTDNQKTTALLDTLIEEERKHVISLLKLKEKTELSQ